MIEYELQTNMFNESKLQTDELFFHYYTMIAIVSIEKIYWIFTIVHAQAQYTNN